MVSPVVAYLMLPFLFLGTANASGQKRQILLYDSSELQRYGFYLGSDPTSSHWNPALAEWCFASSVRCADKLHQGIFLTCYGKWLFDSTTNDHICGNVGCNRRAERRCKTCKNIYYCSLQCQRDHWKHHKQVCSSNVRVKDVKLHNYEKAEYCFKKAMLYDLRFGFSNRMMGKWDEDINQHIDETVRTKRKRKYRIKAGCRIPKNSNFSESAFQLATLWSKRYSQHERAEKLLTWTMEVIQVDEENVKILAKERDQIQSRITGKGKNKQDEVKTTMLNVPMVLRGFTQLNEHEYVCDLINQDKNSGCRIQMKAKVRI